MIGDTRQGWALLAAMTLVFIPLLVAVYVGEAPGNPLLAELGADQVATATNPGGNMEGKEVRFGVANSALWAVATTSASNGSVNSMHDSFMPLAGMIPMWLLQLGEVIFGGVGSGLYGMIMFALVAVFIAGLMIGRTPEYLGKKIGAFEIKMASIAILLPPLFVLCGTAVAVMVDAGKAGVANPGRARVLGNPLRVLVGQQQQRQRVRRAFRQYAVLQHGARHLHALRALLARDSRAGARRRVRRREARATVGGNAADAYAALRGRADQHGDHRRGADLRPGAGPWPRGRAPAALRRQLTVATSRGIDMATLAAKQTALSWFVSRDAMKTALIDSFRRLTPRYQWRNPVMFVVYIGSILTTILWLQALTGKGEAPAGFILAVTLWLWVTLLFANFAEAIAEGRSKAQAASLKSARKDTIAKKLARPQRDAPYRRRRPPRKLRKGDIVLVEQGDLVPGDGEVIVGVASINESAITGESAPVIRAAGSDFNTVTGGTLVLSDWIIVRINVNPGEAFLDRMIGMVEGAKRQKTPNEIALTILLVAMTLVFLLATVTLLPYSLYSVEVAKAGTPVTITVLVALLVCLIPTTIGGLLSAIGVAGMGRMMRANVIATSGRAVEAAGDCDVLLLDKTGTITHGNRQASALHPGRGRDAAASWPRRRCLPRSATKRPKARASSRSSSARSASSRRRWSPGKFTIIPFSAQTRMSGVTFQRPRDPQGRARRDPRLGRRPGRSGRCRGHARVEEVARRGATPLVVAEGKHVLGVIELKDIVKTHIKERFAELRRMGIKTIMITGDNKLTAASIAAEAGTDDFLAEVTPEAKLKLIREIQARRQAGRNDRRRHQRCAGAGAGGRRRGDEQRHAGGEGSRQHGRPRLESDQADRDRRDRQAVADDARRADHVLDRQRRREIFRDHSGGVRQHLPGARRAQRDAASRRPHSAILSAVIFNALIIPALIPLALRASSTGPVGAARSSAGTC